MLTPLTAIRANAELLEQNDNLNAQQKTNILTIINKSDQINNMINKLTLYNSLKKNTYQFNKVLVEGQEFFEMAITGYEKECLKNKIQFTPTVNVNSKYKLDPKLIIEVINNLMDNAIRYTPHNGKLWLSFITLSTNLPKWVFDAKQKNIPSFLWENGIFIIVQNEGNTINREEKELVFNPFIQNECHRNKSRGQGFGLGLSICQNIIKKHKGYINFFPSEKKGSTVIAWLPKYNYLLQ